MSEQPSLPAALLGRALRIACRIAPTPSVHVQRGALIARGQRQWVACCSSAFEGEFSCPDTDKLSEFLGGGRGSVQVETDEEHVLLRGSDRQVEVGPPAKVVAMPSAPSTLTLRILRQDLVAATEPYARRDRECFLEYLDEHLHLIDFGRLTAIPCERLDAGPPVVARAILAKELRRIGTSCRSEYLELHVHGEWNGQGPLRIVCEESGGLQITAMMVGRSYEHVRQLMWESQRLRKEAAETQHRCEFEYDPYGSPSVDETSITLASSCRGCGVRQPVTVRLDRLDQLASKLDLRAISPDYITHKRRMLEGRNRHAISEHLAEWIRERKAAGLTSTLHQVLGVVLAELAAREPKLFGNLLGVDLHEPPEPKTPEFEDADLELLNSLA